jgi:hypothetical protein
LSTTLCTLTVIVHVPTAKVAFEKLILPEPAVAVSNPPQLFPTLGVVATAKGLGNTSVKLASIGTTFPFVMPKVIVLTVVPVPAVV